MSHLTATVASWFDRDDLVIEITAGDDDFALVTRDAATGQVTIQIHPPPSAAGWILPLDEVRRVLEQATSRLPDVAASATVS